MPVLTVVPAAETSLDVRERELIRRERELARRQRELGAQSARRAEVAALLRRCRRAELLLAQAAADRAVLRARTA